MRHRDNSAELTSKNGFSVVAPTRNTRPSSTAGSSVSCCALLKRWISSRKKIVGSPLVVRRWAAGPAARGGAAVGALPHGANLLPADVHGRGLLERRPGIARQQPGQGGLARA